MEENRIEHYSYEKIKKSAYVLALISTEQFFKQGEVEQLACGAYFIKKEYKGTPEYETCALLGVPTGDIFNFILEDSDYLSSMRNDPKLKYIDCIEHLTCKYLQDAIFKFRTFFNLSSKEKKNQLLILNIEPMGVGHTLRSYPVPRISVPGGTMEDKDENDFEKCGLREFREETGIDISNCHDTLSREKLKKGFRFTHFNTFKPKNKFKCSFLKNKHFDDFKSISMFYLVEIK